MQTLEPSPVRRSILSAAPDDFSISGSALPLDGRVAAFDGSEGISRCYAFDVWLVTETEGLEVEDAIGSRVTLTANAPGGGLITQGMIGALEHARALHDPRTGVTRSLYKVRIVPRLWFVGLDLHSRIFTHRSIIEVIREVLIGEGIPADDVELRLERDYPVEEHVCQYKESSLSFVSRWMEREGLTYFFEQGEERERLIITDRPHDGPRSVVSAIPYRPTSDDDHSAGASFDEIAVAKTSTAACVRLDDYDYVRPGLDLAALVPVEAGLEGEVIDYGVRAFEPERTKHLTEVRAEALRASSLTYSMKGSVYGVRSGHLFEVEGHPRGHYNVEYLAARVTHHGHTPSALGAWGSLLRRTDEAVYRVEVNALPVSVPYRAPRSTPWPTIDGYENAIVDGENESDYAQIDEHGRYLLRFRFDEGSRIDGKTSTRVRMMQPHGGGTEGFHFPLRRGTEVLCAFLSGDVDRPVIIGVVPNATKPSPVVQKNHTQNVIQTGGSSYVCIDDLQGAKFANLLCPYVPGMESELYLGVDRPNAPTMLTSPSGPQRSQVGQFAVPISNPNLQLRTTGTGMVSTVGPLDVSANGVLQLESDTAILLYAPTQSQHTAGAYEVHIEGASNEVIDGTWNLEVTGAVTQAFAAQWLQSVASTVSHRWQGAVEQTFTGPHKLSIDHRSEQSFANGLEITVGSANEIHDVTPSFFLKAAVDVSVTAQQEVRVVGKDEVSIFSAKKIEIATAGGASIVLENDRITLSAAHVDVMASAGDLVLRGGPMVKINT